MQPKIMRRVLKALPMGLPKRARRMDLSPRSNGVVAMTK